MVCEKKTALEVIEKNLRETDNRLASLVALVEDVNAQRDTIITSVRDRLNNNPKYASFNQNSYTKVSVPASTY